MRKKILLLTLTLSAVVMTSGCGCGKPKTVEEDIVAESEKKRYS